MHKNHVFGWAALPSLRFYDPDDQGGDGDGVGDDDGGHAAGEHPDFEIPGGVAGAGEGQPAGGAKPAAAAAGQPAGSASGQGDGTGQPGQPGTTDTVPGYRLKEVVAREAALKTQLEAMQAENAKFKKLISGALGIEDPSNPGAPKPLDARQQQIADRIVELLPWLKDLKLLADKVKPLSGLADSVPEFQRQNEAYWKRHAAATMSSMEEAIAPLILGEGKKATDLSQATRQRYRTDFIGWVRGDAARVERYEAADTSLVDDYRKELEETVVAPIRRQSGAAALQAGRQRARLPVAGSGSGPVAGAAPKKPEALDEDSAANAAWKKLQELTAVGG